MSHRAASPPAAKIARSWRSALLLAAILPVAGTAGELPAAGPAVPVVPARLTLPQCIELALAHQPRIAASRATLASAELGLQGLESLRVPDLLIPELPCRRSQAALGVSAARAGLAQAERQAVYAVTRAYLTVAHARSQERLASGVAEGLDTVRVAAKQQVDAGAREVTSTDVDRSLVFVRLAQTRRTEARLGVKRALASLKEAIGAGPAYVFDVAASEVPDSKAAPVLESVVAQALEQREELSMANAFARIVCIEAQAQATSHRSRMETFAAGSDIHAFQVPQEMRDGEYRPGALPPEMPTLLVGKRPQRVERAKALHARAVAVAGVARNLVALETEDAFLRWQQAEEQSRQAREAADTADQLAENLRKDFVAMQKVRVQEVTTAQVTAATARGQLNDYLYRKAIALADLERATAGQFCGGLAGQALPASKEKPSSPAR